MGTKSSRTAYLDPSTGLMIKGLKNLAKKLLSELGDMTCHEMVAAVNKGPYKRTNVRTMSTILSDLYYEGWADYNGQRVQENGYTSEIYKVRSIQLSEYGQLERQLSQKLDLLKNTVKAVEEIESKMNMFKKAI